MKKSKVIVAGSSGYVASNLIPWLQKQTCVFGIDQSFSDHTHLQAGIESAEFSDWLTRFDSDEIFIINLAAARSDFGAVAKDYFRLNVENHIDFLKSLELCKIKKFIHVSSVAAIDGRSIEYSEDLNCDDAYRSTKYLQEKLVQNWCDKRAIELFIVYPSAIFSRDPRSDTNIGKLQSISRLLPFIPSIDVIKSLTFLPNLSKFITDLVVDDIPAGKYLTIEQPSLTVTEMIQIVSGRPVRLVRIPGIKFLLKIIAYFFYIVGGFGKIDLKLTPNRVIKLFSDTSYNNLDNIDTETYVLRNKDKLSDLLKGLNIRSYSSKRKR